MNLGANFKNKPKSEVGVSVKIRNLNSAERVVGGKNVRRKNVSKEKPIRNFRIRR